MTADGGRAGRAEVDLLGPLEGEPSVSAVAQRLIQVIASGALERGSRLPPERQLAERLGVGRSTVREALAVLDVLGIVTTRHGSGTYVRSTSSSLLSNVIDWGLILDQPRTLDLVELRQDLEAASARHAAERAAAADLEALAACLERMRASVRDPAAFAEADVEFHLLTATAGRNSVIVELLSSVRSLLQVWVARAVAEEADLSGTLREHELVYDAIAIRDPEGAAEAMAAHMASASSRLRRSLRHRH
ncbi:FadR/GntR family transcriptional regulator [Homoserinibacter sp. YIM 151385]|uniref:FadR/GntR family transcriptional regulator n=1 Tax=Homoserinibacter sp. YIM 151385 TaxID=2985506 RepID=UPI0022F0C164|nr:FCD domain-containing protein [Homoserinibacter sp. YIM 151385]WBU37092.1 FCD domain-containing protein [Homoserinibacter sp. YIM 151385]